MRGEIGVLVAILPDVRKKVDKSGPDAFIARLAARQHGVVSTAQLRSAGLLLPRDQPPCRNRPACTAFSRRIRRVSESGGRGESDLVHVTVPSTAGKKRRNGIALHRSSTLLARDRTRHDGIPVTRPGRTLADLRPLLSPAQFAAALREAEFLRLPIENRFESEGARTELERRMIALCRRHRLPQPGVNVRVDRYEVDFLSREHSLVVEVDGWDWRQLTTEGAAVAKTIRALLRGR
jgi:hypothetical protein